MARLTEAEFKKHLSAKDYSGLYLLFGEEKLLVKQYTDKLVEKIVGKKPSDFNFHRMKQSTPTEEIISCAEMIPFTADINCILITDYNVDEIGESDFSALCKVFEDISETTIMIFSMPTLDINMKSSRQKRFISRAEDFGIVLKCDKKEQAALEKQLVSWAGKRGNSLSSANAAKIIAYCGSDLLTLENELEKLCAYKDYSGEITLDDINLLTTKNLEAKVFKLADYVITGNSDAAYKQLDLLFYQHEEPIAVLAVLSGAYVDMYRVRVALESGEKASVLEKSFDYGKKAFRLKNAERDGKRLTTTAMRKSLDEILETDYKMKSTRADKRVLMETLISKLIMLTHSNE